jgi:hypothetical protein
LYYKASEHFKWKLGVLLHRGKLSAVRQWWHIADAVVLTALISTPDEVSYDVINQLTRWVLENCANNYAQFSKDLKSLKKDMRKHYAIHGDLSRFHPNGTMLPYVSAFREAEKYGHDSPASFGRLVLLWTQTRATGLADGTMIRKSIEKFMETTGRVGEHFPVNPEVLIDTLGGARCYNPADARVSVGPSASLENTREEGGKTQTLKHLAKHKVLRTVYDWETLQPSAVAPRAVRNVKDVVDWAIQTALNRPTYIRCVRVHSVAEPGKARTITIAPYAYQVIMGIFAHVYQSTLKSKSVRSGLRADRHLWRFLQDTLNPQNEAWQYLEEDQIFAVSTDLEQSTDYGNRSFAKQVLSYMIRLTPDMPQGLSVLMKTLFTAQRYAFVPCYGGYKLHIVNTGWFMGDMMTKFMLTVGHDYCCRLSNLKVWTLVGDDEVALASSPLVLERHIENLRTLFKVSEADTYVSSHFAFYCEEGMLIPQKASQSNHVLMRRRRELNYLDYPRIRLLLDIKAETDLYSATNAGRFALLGKECRWAHLANPAAEPMFTRAMLYQHLMVPQDSDTLCPYTPIEMGGDGAFPHSPGFLRRVVEGPRSRNPREVIYRMSSLLKRDFNYKFVRSDRLDTVVHKHHLFLPKVEGLRDLLPAEAIIEPQTDEAKIMLRSLRFRDVEVPEATYMRLCRDLFYQEIFRGKEPTEPVFKINRSFTGGRTTTPYVNFHIFIEVWKNPGFRFQDNDTYFVRKSIVQGYNPMHLGFPSGEGYPSSRDLMNDWAEASVSFTDSSLTDVLLMIQERRPLPPRVVARLNLFLESDAYILHMLPEIPTMRVLGIVSRDIKLGVRVRNALDGRQTEHHHEVFCLDPLIYVAGRTDDIPSSGWVEPPTEWIPDPGSILQVDYTEFTDGVPHMGDALWDGEIHVSPTRFDRVFRVHIVDATS